MGLYLCYYLNGDGSIPLFDSVEAETETEALERGARLLRSAPERAALEVWAGGRRVSTLVREEASA